MQQNILKEDRVSSTIHFINKYIRSATNQMQAKSCKSDYFVMNGNTVEALINTYQNKAAQTALVVDDLGLQVTNRLFQEGLKQITLCLTRIPEDKMSIVKSIITKTFPEIKINIIHIEEITKNMEYDLIISNPPYSSIGANITKKIIDTIDFGEFINMLPANDYKRNNTKDLFNYQSDMKPAVPAGEKAFPDAGVTTHIARIHKTKVNSMTLDEFEINQYLDHTLNKYFIKNINSLIPDAISKSLPFTTKCKNNLFTPDTTFILGWRDVNHKHLPKSKNCTTYKWNVEQSIDCEYVWNNHKNKNNTVWFYNITFNSAIEKTNFTNFIYSNLGQKFCSKLWTAMNVDGTAAWNNWFPKVDWTRAWTVEEILADYGYTEAEIKAVMDDLVNFRGMEE